MPGCRVATLELAMMDGDRSVSGARADFGVAVVARNFLPLAQRLPAHGVLAHRSGYLFPALQSLFPPLSFQRRPWDSPMSLHSRAASKSPAIAGTDAGGSATMADGGKYGNFISKTHGRVSSRPSIYINIS